MTIDPGVTLQPYFTNTSRLRADEDPIDLLFIDADGGIENVFDNLVDSVTLGFTAEKRDGDKKYYLTVYRKADVQSLLPRDIPHRNGNSVINSIGSYFATGNTCPAMQRIWDHLDNSPTLEELHARARRIGSTLAPEAYADMPKIFLHMLDIVDSNFLRQIRTAHTFGASDASNGQWRIWATPLFYQSLRNRAKTQEFEHSKDKFYGSSLGASRQWDRLAVGMEGHYLRGSYDSDCSRIDSDNFGFRIGARVGSLAPEAGGFNPWAAFSLGYDHSRMDQRNVDLFGGKRTSKPSAHMMTEKLEAGHGVLLRDNHLLTPIVGLEYAHIRQGGYRDKGSSDYLLRVGGNSYHSLRLRAGLRAETRIGEQTYFSLWGNYRFETMHTHASFDSAFASCPGVSFVARGEDRSRSSGTLGAGLRHTIGRAQLSADYDLSLESRYLAHRVGVRIAVDF